MVQWSLIRPHIIDLPIMLLLLMLDLRKSVWDSHPPIDTGFQPDCQSAPFNVGRLIGFTGKYPL
ncbi:MAG: hypothetical protein JWO06_573 [Bacteroidota bacterium]|nr:hypothetical protein [Bacteroidota bacterium]